MLTFVLDTSALIRLYVPDGPVPDGVAEAIEKAQRSEAALLAPELILAEAGQVLLKKTRARLIDGAVADEILAAILELPIDLVSHRGLMAAALDVARRSGLSVYDGIFVALAKREKARLLSADRDVLAAMAAS